MELNAYSFDYDETNCALKIVFTFECADTHQKHALKVVFTVECADTHQKRALKVTFMFECAAAHQKRALIMATKEARIKSWPLLYIY